MKGELRDCNLNELMIIEAANRIADENLVLVGTGFPMVATALASKTHAPNLIAVVESGAIDPIITRAPVSVAGSTIMHKASRLGSLKEVLGCILQRGLVDVGFLGGAQIDQFGNINSTAIGTYTSPKVRLPGSGGANDIATHSKRVLVIVPHERRRFPTKCDYVTSPGYISGGQTRKTLGFRNPTPPLTVVTNMAIMDANPETGRLRVTHTMPGVDLDAVMANTGFEPEVSPALKTVDAPPEHYVQVLREEVDPDRVYLDRIQPAA